MGPRQHYAKAQATPGDSERIRYQRIVAALTAALGETVFAAAWEEGRVLTLEQAIAEGLSSAGQ